MNSSVKIVVLSVVFCNVIFLSSFSQNLVPNPSFEDTLYCPTVFDDLGAAKFWYKPTQGTSDYFNSCNVGGVSVPYNDAGYQNARTGNAYAGLDICYDSPPFCDLHYREYLQIKMTSPLTNGKRYIVSAYIAKADSAPIVLKNIGIAISDTIIGGGYSTPIPFIPQIVYPQFLMDTDWVKISDTVTAIGGEQYLTIGNFNYNNTNDTMSLFYTSANFYRQAYYYIDDISVTEDTTTGVNEMVFEEDISIYINDGILFLEMSKSAKIVVEIYGLMGQLMYSDNPAQISNNYSINLSRHINGFYLIRLKTNDVLVDRKFILLK